MQRTIRVCDLHDGDDVSAVETVIVRMTGRYVQLDACQAHLDLLAALPSAPASVVQDDHEDTHPVTTSTGRRRQSTRTPAPRAGGPQPGSRRQLQRERAAVREWARQNGRDVGHKGRLPSGLVEEYRRTQTAAAS